MCVSAECSRLGTGIAKYWVMEEEIVGFVVQCFDSKYRVINFSKIFHPKHRIPRINGDKIAAIVVAFTYIKLSKNFNLLIDTTLDQIEDSMAVLEPTTANEQLLR